MAIAAPTNLVKLVRQSSAHSTPGYAVHPNPFTATHPSSPAGVVMVVSEIANIILASFILPSSQPDHRKFAHSPDVTDVRAVFASEDSEWPKVLADQMTQLESGPVQDGDRVLFASQTGREVWEEADGLAVRWWSELMGTGESVDNLHPRRGSLFTFGGDPDEEVELCVAVLVSNELRKESLPSIASNEYARAPSGRK